MAMRSLMRSRSVRHGTSVSVDAVHSILILVLHHRLD